MNSTNPDSSTDLVKFSLATRLREQIVSGGIRPGERIIEGRWSRQLGVAQASIREAINILIQEGFVVKSAGRSARVIAFTKEDVYSVYEVRGALEGLAGRLVAQRKAEIVGIEDALKAMRNAICLGDARGLLDADLRFHMELCEASGNSFLTEQARRILLPFFAFVRIRVQATHQQPEAWNQDLQTHQRMIDLIKEGHGDLVEQYIKLSMHRFAANSYESWERDEPKAEFRLRRLGAIAGPVV